MLGTRFFLAPWTPTACLGPRGGTIEIAEQNQAACITPLSSSLQAGPGQCRPGWRLSLLFSFWGLAPTPAWLLLFRAPTAQFLSRGQAATSKPPWRSELRWVPGQPGAPPEAGSGVGRGAMRRRWEGSELAGQDRGGRGGLNRI